MTDRRNRTTEEEAKLRLCPYARPSFPLNCLGSKCMAWRWQEENPVYVRPDKMPIEGEGYCALIERRSV